MIYDAKHIFSDAQAITTQATHYSTNIIDLENALSGSTHLWLHVRVGTAFTSDGSGTLSVELLQSATNSSASGAATGIKLDTVAKTALTAGKKLLSVKLPTNLLQYLELKYTIGTAAMTAGTLDAVLSPDDDSRSA
jgi:hypothetical protein